MKKIVLILIASISGMAYSADWGFSLSGMIGTQFQNQNEITALIDAQIGGFVDFDFMRISLFGEGSAGTGYPYRLEYNAGASIEFLFFETGGFGAGYYIFGNLFPAIKGRGYGSDIYNMHYIRLHAVFEKEISEKLRFRTMPFVSYYYDPYESSFNQSFIVKNDRSIGFGIMIGVSLNIKRKKEVVLLDPGDGPKEEICIEYVPVIIEVPTENKYEVKLGDYLRKISTMFYGNEMLWPIIFNANRPLISHPDEIEPGWLLTIPEREEQE